MRSPHTGTHPCEAKQVLRCLSHNPSREAIEAGAFKTFVEREY